ncbi:MAG TPA: hypothetical protein VD861_12150, partial [Pyrinomonadaceae bacterium]|nr:hypothetical protein [Pyrinomonadaceae bacterium]
MPERERTGRERASRGRAKSLPAPPALQNPQLMFYLTRYLVPENRENSAKTGLDHSNSPCPRPKNTRYLGNFSRSVANVGQSMMLEEAFGLQNYYI